MIQHFQSADGNINIFPLKRDGVHYRIVVQSPKAAITTFRTPEPVTITPLQWTIGHGVGRTRVNRVPGDNCFGTIHASGGDCVEITCPTEESIIYLCTYTETRPSPVDQEAFKLVSTATR